MDLQEAGLKGVEWIHLVQDRNQWRFLWMICLHGISLVARFLLAFQERLSYAELVMESIWLIECKENNMSLQAEISLALILLASNIIYY
jgi:hypothetical protein